MSQAKQGEYVKMLWHSSREVPELNRFVLILLPDKSFAMDNIVNNKCWLFYLEKYPECKWLYCDKLIEREYPTEFCYDFLQQLQMDCFFASKKLASTPSKSKKYITVAGALQGVWMEIQTIVEDFNKK